MTDLRTRALNYGRMILDFMSGASVESVEQSMAAASANHDHEPWNGDGGPPESLHGRIPVEGSYEHGEGKTGSNLLKWLSRLIGTEGKTLGEFLREYQVHVLYDLAFTFIKWVFFIYVGLLIP